jgi:hypothetical protein
VFKTFKLWHTESVTESTEPKALNRANPDPISLAGMLVVGIAAAVLSFSTWVHLAEAVGFVEVATVHPPLGETFTLRIAWLLPLAVDCYTLTVIRVWLNSPPGSQVIEYAKANAIGAIVLTVAAQAAYHAFTAAGASMTQLWWFAIVVGGIPPLLLGLVMDLYTRRKNEQRAAEQAGSQPVADRVANPAPVLSTYVEDYSEPQLRPRTQPTAKANGRVESARRTAGPSKGEPAGVHAIGKLADDDLMVHVYPVVESWVADRGEPPGQHTVRNALRALKPPIHIGLKRAGQLVDRAVQEPRETPMAGEPQAESSPDDPLEEHHADHRIPALAGA